MLRMISRNHVINSMFWLYGLVYHNIDTWVQTVWHPNHGHKGWIIVIGVCILRAIWRGMTKRVGLLPTVRAASIISSEIISGVKGGSDATIARSCRRAWFCALNKAKDVLGFKEVGDLCNTPIFNKAMRISNTSSHVEDWTSMTVELLCLHELC
ncbi:hypothetical protein VNO78_35895 [Psophocarpus tetragonolobus]|uniref:Uncharacterized protein n=1 Tax=Psophocarpus tetragonolobus TaxID=3891 RepID=A0AAN9NQN2_PSOTE